MSPTFKIASACLFLLAVPATGQVPSTLPSHNGGRLTGVEPTGDGVVLNFRDAPIDLVLTELAEAAGLVIVRQVEPEGRVTLESRRPVSSREAVALLNTVLYEAGYAAVLQERVLKVMDAEAARTGAIPVRSGADPDEIARSDELITQVIPLRYADAKQLLEDLEPVVSADAPFTANASSNALVLTDTSANVRRVVEIINALDQSLAESVTVRVFQLEFADATATARLINDVFGNLQFGTGPGESEDAAIGRAIRRRFGGRGGGGGEEEAGARGGTINAAADERTNAVVVSGPGDTMRIVEEVVEEIDSNPVADEEVFVYRLRNAQATNVETVVNAIFGNGPSPTLTQQDAAFSNPLLDFRDDRGGSGPVGGGGQFGGQVNVPNQARQRQAQAANGRLSPQAQQAVAGLAGQVSIIADADTNSLLIRTSPANYERVKGVLDELDEPVPQVLIKVLVAEVTHEDSVDVGTELSVLNLRANGLGQEAGSNFNIPTQGATATGLVVQILEQDFTATIRALETEGKLEVLSRPYILASDNQVASITVGQSIPFITSSRITDEGGIINTTQYDDVGILLDVIPHVNPDGLVILDVAPEISALTGSSVQLNEQFSQPIIAKRSAISRVGVRDGSTIVIGGLMEDRRTETVSKIPILGDIPFLGAAFRRTEISTAKTELLIFLTPHVASQPAEVEAMTDEELETTNLLQDAVDEDRFEEQMEGMRSGSGDGG
jgi:general secretion pathway protein D